MAANYLHLPGVTGNFAWIPGIANLDGTGTLEFIAKVNLDVWPSDANQILISKWTGSAGYLFFLESTSNDLKLMWRDSGPARIAQATVTPTVTAGDWLWFCAVATEDGVDRDVFFYTSTDTTNDPDDVTWTQLGAEVVVPYGAADLTTNTAVVFVGAQNATVATMAGSIAAARVNFAGVTELDIDFTDLTAAEVDAGSFIEDSSNAATVTIAGTAWSYVSGQSLPAPQKRFFLDSFTGDGTEENPFRPATAGGDYGIIDLRADATQQAGLCLVGAETGVGEIDFGDTLDQQFSSAIKIDLGGRLGLTLDQTDFRGIIAELLLLHGREDGTRWRGLKQNKSGRHKIMLGGQVVYDAPAIQGAIFTDNFNRADETLETSANWAKVDGSMNINTNEVDITTTSSTYRCESAMDSDDHYVQADLIVANNGPGINARMSEGDASNWDAYHFRRNTAGGGFFNIFEVTNNSFSNIGTNTEDPTVPYTIKGECNGSTIRLLVDGVEKISVTDTVLTGQVKTGFRDTNGGTSNRWDDYEASDLAADTRFIRSNLQSRQNLQFDADRLVSTGLISAGKST